MQRGQEIDLLARYPKSLRAPRQVTAQDRYIARRFGRQFFDGERRHGYGGYRYDPRFWQPVVETFIEWYGRFDSLLDVGCAKGFMLRDFQKAIPHLHIAGLDISSYAIKHCLRDMAPFLEKGCATELPFESKSFDLVVSINTIHNLDRAGCVKALREIQRVGRDAFVTVDAYRTTAEQARMLSWNLTAQTILHVDEWKALFAEAGYTGDYFWFWP